MGKENLSDKELDDLLNRLSETVRGPQDRYSADESYLKLREKLQFERKRRIPLFRYVAAASVAIVFILSTYLLFNTHNPKIITVVTTNNTEEINLPDGSQVVLSRYSSLQYPAKFNKKERDIILSGEAYFDVAKDEAHPFIVHADNMRVKVLGTKFNVESYANDKYIKTTLLEGKVAVSSGENDTPTILNPNEMAIFNKQSTEIQKEADENAIDKIAWREGKHIFNNKPLLEIAHDLSNYFNTQIKIDDQNLQTYRLTARFEQNENIEDILNILQKVANFKWTKMDETITITPNN